MSKSQPSQGHQEAPSSSSSKQTSNTPTTTPPSPTPPMRQIRASYTANTITVYQAYNDAIATAALSTQRLDDSPQYKPGRATWIKPSWTWMLYRSGYSFKDANQSHILALHMTHEYFIALLRCATLANQPHGKGEGVVVQWDPERGPRLEKLPWRSIQIGIMGTARERWIAEGIVAIEDVTPKARELKRVLDREGDGHAVTERELRDRGLLPDERPFEVPDEVRRRLEMD